MNSLGEHDPVLTDRIRNVPVFLTHMLADMGNDMKRHGGDVISIAGTAVAGDTPQHLKEATQKAIDQGYTGYPPLRGAYELREAIAEKMKRVDHLDVNAETEVLVTMGGEEAIFLAVQALISPGDEVLMTAPSYPFDLHIEYAGGKPIFVPLREPEFKLESDEFRRRITPQTRMITFVNPHNPCGRVFTRKEIEDLAHVAQQHDLYVLEDIVNEGMIFDDREKICMASLPGMSSRTIVESSFTKCYGISGWRIGYCVADKHIIDQMSKLHMVINNVGPPLFVQKAAEQVYRGPQKPLREIVDRCQEKRDFVYKRFNEMPNVRCHKPEGTVVALPNISGYEKSSLEFAEWLLKEARVVTAAGIQYHAEGHIRANFSSPRIDEAVDRIEAALKRRGPL